MKYRDFFPVVWLVWVVVICVVILLKYRLPTDKVPDYFEHLEPDRATVYLKDGSSFTTTNIASAFAFAASNSCSFILYQHHGPEGVPGWPMETNR